MKLIKVTIRIIFTGVWITNILVYFSIFKKYRMIISKKFLSTEIIHKLMQAWYK